MNNFLLHGQVPLSQSLYCISVPAAIKSEATGFLGKRKQRSREREKRKREKERGLGSPQKWFKEKKKEKREKREKA